MTAGGPETRRYRLLESIRFYAGERLAASGTEATVRRQHADYYLGWAERAAAGLRTSRQRSSLERMTTEQPNLRAALTYAVVTIGWLAAARR